MRTGAEVKVGVITLLAIALLLAYVFYFQGVRARGATYMVSVIFADARGLQHGDPVRMAGVSIGEVDKVQIEEIERERKAKAYLAISKEHVLYDNYRFRIGASGLLQERFVEVVTETRDPYVSTLEDGVCVEGLVRPDLADLMDAGSGLLDNLDRTSRRLSLVLGDQEILAGIRDALQSFSQLADATTALTEKANPDILAALKGVNAAVGQLQGMTAELRVRVTEGPALADLEATTQHVREVAANAERITNDLAGLTGDPEVQQELRGTLAALHDAAQSAKKIGADLELLSSELRKAAPAIPRVTEEAGAFADASAAFRERLKPPEIDAAFDILYSGEDDRFFSSGRLDISTSKERFLRFGVEDIGEDSDVNIQLGERQRRAVLRYGLVRSTLGLGADFDLPRNITLSLDIFDPNDIRADLLADVPLVLGRSDWSILAGVRDIGDEERVVGGIRLKR